MTTYNRDLGALHEQLRDLEYRANREYEAERKRLVVQIEQTEQAIERAKRDGGDTR